MSHQDTHTSRRHFIQSSVLISLSTILAGCNTQQSNEAQIENQEDILESLSYSQDELDEIVDAYLLGIPSRRTDLEIIGSWYLDGLENPSNKINKSLERITLYESKERTQEQILEQTQRDFEENDLTVVSGWWLSTTESHICSIIYLLD